jgi:putative heme degradation protein
MNTTRMAHKNSGKAAVEEKVQLDGLLPTPKNIGHIYCICANSLIYVHEKSLVYDMCKIGTSVNREAW